MENFPLWLIEKHNKDETDFVNFVQAYYDWLYSYKSGYELDIDGLDMSQCPSSGTPIPGGLMFEEALFLIDEIVASGRTIVAFDLSEVTPGTDLSDAYTGARLLYRLSCATLASQ